MAVLGLAGKTAGICGGMVFLPVKGARVPGVHTECV
jgi:hypothetical protein